MGKTLKVILALLILTLLGGVASAQEMEMSPSADTLGPPVPQPPTDVRASAGGCHSAPC